MYCISKSAHDGALGHRDCAPSRARGHVPLAIAAALALLVALAIACGGGGAAIELAISGRLRLLGLLLLSGGSRRNSSVVEARRVRAVAGTRLSDAHQRVHQASNFACRHGLRHVHDERLVIFSLLLLLRFGTRRGLFLRVVDGDLQFRAGPAPPSAAIVRSATRADTHADCSLLAAAFSPLEASAAFGSPPQVMRCSGGCLRYDHLLGNCLDHVVRAERFGEQLMEAEA